MAWDDGQRREHLHKVVCLSRFLIRPGVACAYLASHVLGRILRRLPRDFEICYSFRPWHVETFLEAQYDGASLRAANFVRVGETAGRGRQDRENRWDRPVKLHRVKVLGEAPGDEARTVAAGVDRLGRVDAAGYGRRT